MLSLNPIFPFISLMPNWISSYFFELIRVVSDFAFPLVAFTSTGTRLSVVLTKNEGMRYKTVQMNCRYIRKGVIWRFIMR